MKGQCGRCVWFKYCKETHKVTEKSNCVNDNMFMETAKPKDNNETLVEEFRLIGAADIIGEGSLCESELTAQAFVTNVFRFSNEDEIKEAFGGYKVFACPYTDLDAVDGKRVMRIRAWIWLGEYHECRTCRFRSYVDMCECAESSHHEEYMNGDSACGEWKPREQK